MRGNVVLFVDILAENAADIVIISSYYRTHTAASTYIVKNRHMKIYLKQNINTPQTLQAKNGHSDSGGKIALPSIRSVGLERVWGSAVSSPSGIWGSAVADIDFCAL